jgi:hypothetical protein
MEAAMTKMEQHYVGEIVAYAMDNFKGIEDLSHEEMVNSFWNEYFESCEMCDPETGLEMPHEEDFTYSYHPNADEYNSRYGW